MLPWAQQQQSREMSFRLVGDEKWLFLLFIPICSITNENKRIKKHVSLPFKNLITETFFICALQYAGNIYYMLITSTKLFFLSGFTFTRLFYRVQYPTYHQQGEILSLFCANIKNTLILDIAESHYLKIPSLKYFMLQQCCNNKLLSCAD